MRLFNAVFFNAGIMKTPDDPTTLFYLLLDWIWHLDVTAISSRSLASLVSDTFIK